VLCLPKSYKYIFFGEVIMIKQKGFTLLELLVVITLLAILAVGGLVAYDGVGENAEAAAGAYNITALDRSVRQYRAVTNSYPDQWDSLSSPIAAAPAGGSNLLAEETQAAFGAWEIGANPAYAQAVVDRIRTSWGMEEIQYVVGNFDPAEVAPGKAHNEGTGISSEFAFYDEDNNNEWDDQFQFISIVPSFSLDDGACTAGGESVGNFLNGDVADAAASLALNAMNDAMGTGRCHLVIALGFGGDAASSTSRSSVSIPAAPTYTSPNINPSQHYGRYIGLFHMGRTTSDSVSQNDVGIGDLFPRPRLIGFVTPEGTPVDVLVQGTRSPEQ
jgi:prepilin-type N-terminal cleavage/methylation domain-containing protein